MNKQIPTKSRLSQQEVLNMLMNMLAMTENRVLDNNSVVEVPIFTGDDRVALKNQLLELTGVITLTDEEPQEG